MPAMRSFHLVACAVVVVACGPKPSPTAAPHAFVDTPIIDVHVHAFPRWDPQPWWPKDLAPAATEDALHQETIAELRRLHVEKAVTSGDLAHVSAWRTADPDLIVPGILLSTDLAIDQLREAIREGQIAVLGETVFQYEGLAPDDAKLEPYYALAEEMDVPIAMHIGIGPPGFGLVSPYTVAAGDPLRFEPVLKKHPKLRLLVQHAGWPMIDNMVALLFAYPNVYVDVGVIDWYVPRAEFHVYLRRLVQAGFSDRILFGSDQMMWPGAIARGVEAIQTADFLDATQKRAILHDNAVRFLRLKR